MLLGSAAEMHVLANATPRFRVPWLPVLAVYASYAVWSLPTLPRRLKGASGIAAFGFLLFFFAVCLPCLWIRGGRP